MPTAGVAELLKKEQCLTSGPERKNETKKMKTHTSEKEIEVLRGLRLNVHDVDALWHLTRLTCFSVCAQVSLSVPLFLHHACTMYKCHDDIAQSTVVDLLVHAPGRAWRPSEGSRKNCRSTAGRAPPV